MTLKYEEKLKHFRLQVDVCDGFVFDTMAQYDKKTKEAKQLYTEDSIKYDTVCIACTTAMIHSFGHAYMAYWRFLRELETNYTVTKKRNDSKKTKKSL
jgi:uncharacterized protein YfbU (UPF0304 family)